jgi:hypothetical protein
MRSRPGADVIKVETKSEIRQRVYEDHRAGRLKGHTTILSTIIEIRYIVIDLKMCGGEVFSTIDQADVFSTT